MTSKANQQEEWTEQNCIDLIGEFRKKRMLWDPSNIFYYKKGVKPQAWQEIGDAIGMPAKAAKHKMIVLMSSFRREKSKILHSIREAASSPDPSSVKLYKSTWFAFRNMAFLMDKGKRVKGSYGQDPEGENEDLIAMREDNRILKETLLEHYIDASVLKKRKQTRLPKSQLTDTDSNTEEPVEVSDEEEIYEDDLIENVMSTSVNPTSSFTGQAEDNEIKSFTEFIASKMRKYSEKTKNAVQQEICEIIFRADRADQDRKRKRQTSTAEFNMSSAADSEIIKEEINFI